MTFTVQTTRLLLICIVGSLLVAPLLHFGVIRNHFPVVDSFQLMALMYVPSLLLGSILGYCVLSILRFVAGGKRAIAANILLSSGLVCLLLTISHWWIGHLNFGVELWFDSPPAAAAFNGLSACLLLSGILTMLRVARELEGEPSDGHGAADNAFTDG